MQINVPTFLRTVVLTVTAGVAACGHSPAFRMTEPERIDTAGKRIAVIGDLQQTAGLVRLLRRREDTRAQQSRLLADLQRQRDELAALVIVGDLVFTARSRRDWSHFDELIAPLAAELPVLPAIGNHDYPCYLVRLCRTSRMARGMAERFPWIEPGQPYTIAAANLLLVFLDSESRLEAQSAWLRAQLDAAAGEFSAALVFFHRPPWSSSIERGAIGNTDVQRFVVPVVRESAVPTVVVNGHIHGFEHFELDAVHYVTTGGGGGPRVAMPNTASRDRYRGPECTLPGTDTVVRPFNYLLVTPLQGQLRIDVRGFCTNDEPVRLLDSFTVAW